MDISTGLNSANAALGEAASRRRPGGELPLSGRRDSDSAAVDGAVPVGRRDTVSPGAALPKAHAPILDGPSLTVTDKATAEAFQAMAQSSYETKMTIIGNMVDTPEERAEKAEREAERQAKELDAKERSEELTERELQNDRILDEIAANRAITDRP